MVAVITKLDSNNLLKKAWTVEAYRDKTLKRMSLIIIIIIIIVIHVKKVVDFPAESFKRYANDDMR